MKAWKVTVSDEISNIYFAETGSKAKYLAHNDCDFSAGEYDFPLDFKAHRYRQADKYYTGESTLDWNTKDGQQAFRDLGWYDYESSYCAECGEHEYSLIEETKLTEVGDELYCKSCIDEMEAEESDNRPDL